VLALRALFRTHRHLALALVTLALAMKMLVPSGYMLSDRAHVLTITICADASGALTTRQVVVPSDGTSGEHAKTEGNCAWAVLATGALGGADVLLLALALAFILALGHSSSRPVPPTRAAYLRPPLRGPPALA
jgi:hypothetical protein